jgi:predicted phosphoadenosine phosphosulfate sulfurtransferase
MAVVHALPRQALDQDVYSLAIERTVYTMRHFDQVYVSFSGGKDSTATLQVALDVMARYPDLAAKHGPLRTVFFDEECIPYETEEYVRRIGLRPDVALEWYCLPVQHRNACSRKSPYWWPWAPEDRERWARPLPAEAITELDGFPIWPPAARLSIPDLNGLLADPARGNAAMLMGIRAQESPTRKRAVSLGGRDKNYLVKFDVGTSRGNLYKSYPIYDWTTGDVWTAPARLGWDYNRAYDIQEMAGVPHASQRCSPAFGEEPLQKLYLYAQCFPDVWARMTDRVPGVGAAVRYARTELYGYGARPAKPDNMTWPDFIVHYVQRHSPAAMASISDRIRDVMARHYRQTSHPLAPKAAHPDTGLSWDFVLMLAMRGDFKERKQPKHKTRSDTEWRTTAWTRYAAELADVIQAGRFPELAHPGPPPPDPWALIPPEYTGIE